MSLADLARMSEDRRIQATPKIVNPISQHPILFLDIDGVLASFRSTFASGNWPHDLDNMDEFDGVAIGMIQRLVREYDARVVVSSTWRMSFTYQQIGKAFDLPTIGSADQGSGIRGEQIKRWLDINPSKTYAILDDSNDMLSEQFPFLVLCDADNGMTAKNYQDLKYVFSGGSLDENTPYGPLGMRSETRILTFH